MVLVLGSLRHQLGRMGVPFKNWLSGNPSGDDAVPFYDRCDTGLHYLACRATLPIGEKPERHLLRYLERSTVRTWRPDPLRRVSPQWEHGADYSIYGTISRHHCSAGGHHSPGAIRRYPDRRPWLRYCRDRDLLALEDVYDPSCSMVLVRCCHDPFVGSCRSAAKAFHQLHFRRIVFDLARSWFLASGAIRVSWKDRLQLFRLESLFRSSQRGTECARRLGTFCRTSERLA